MSPEPATPEHDTTGSSLAAARSMLGSRIARRLKIAFAVERDPDAERIRNVALGWLFGLGFALLGFVHIVPGARLFGHPPFELDRALKTMSLGWFESKRVLPVTLVDIDAATHAAWHSPVITPRAEVVKLLESITSAGPLAVIVDIDLSGDATQIAEAEAGTLALRRYLGSYRGEAPILFPRRIEPDADGRHWETQSPFDDLFSTNGRLHWAHASFTMGGGAVRSWAPWIEVCTQPTDEPGVGNSDIAVARTRWIPAMAVELASSASLPTRVQYGATPQPSGDCRDEASAGEQRLLVGPRLTAADIDMQKSSARAISAATLLEPGIQLETSELFTKRIVLIGATHPSSGDFWITPNGVIPGVEMIADTIRYAPLQHDESRGAVVWRRAATLVFFAMFAVLTWKLRGVPLLAAVVVVTLLLVSIAIGGFDRYDVFDALESAIVLTILYKAAVEVLTLVEEWREHWSRNAGHPRRRRLQRTLWAISSRHAPKGEPHA